MKCSYDEHTAARAPGFRIVRLAFGVIVLAAFFTALVVPQPLRTVCGVIFIAGAVVVLVLTFVHIRHLRNSIRQQRRAS